MESNVTSRFAKAIICSIPATLLLLAAPELHAQPSPCAVGNRVLVEPGDHPATVLATSGGSCRVHYEDSAFADGWTYSFNIKAIDKDAKDAAAAAKGPRLGRYDIT